MPARCNNSRSRTRRGENPGELVIFGLNPSRKRNVKGTAKLTPEEDRAWEKAFEYYLNEGKTDSQADRLAARDVRMEFPRLKKFRKFAANPRRKNPSAAEEQGAELFEAFHGRPAEEVLEVFETAAVRKDYVALGPLVSLTVKPKRGQIFEIKFDDGVMLAADPNGKQLYAIGGDQDLSGCIGKLPGDADKDFVDLGEIKTVSYFDRKAEADFKPVVWDHQLGEEGGTRPRAVFDQIRKRIYFAGGDYRIEGPWIRN